MRIGVRLPASIPGVDGALVLEWARRAEAGPFASLGVIDRAVYPNCEPLVTLGAAAALTQRVRLVSSVLIGPAHDAALLAKQAATIDVLSSYVTVASPPNSGCALDHVRVWPRLNVMPP